MFEIPSDRLPPGFAETVEQTPKRPATPNPAATVVLMRDAQGGIEILLMRRHGAAGFVPGAWVFPGGRVDPSDSGPALYERIEGLSAAPVPAALYWVAAMRELFEETGVLLARNQAGHWVRDGASDTNIGRLRRALLNDEISLLDVLAEIDAKLDASGMVHAAHWITPVVEARRYDTHFFAAALPPGRTVESDPREMTEAVWLTPAAALARFQEGQLPMVFPTVRTLESLDEFDSLEHALDAFRGLTVKPVLPRLVRTARGVAIVLDE